MKANSKWFTAILAFALVAAAFVITLPTGVYANTTAKEAVAATASGSDDAQLETPPPPPKDVPAPDCVAPQAPPRGDCPFWGARSDRQDRPNRGGHHCMQGKNGRCGEACMGRQGRQGRPGMGMMRGNRDEMRGHGIAAERMLHHAKALELSEEQISQLENLSLDAREQMVDLHAALEKEHLALEKLMNSDSDNLTAIRKQLNTLAQKRVDVQVLKLQNWMEVKKILTEDQLQKIRKQHPGKGMGMNMGMGMGANLD